MTERRVKMRHYETIYIVNPNLAEEDAQGVIKKFNDLIEKHKGVIIKIQEWGTQRLAYLLKKFDKGSYVLVDYCGGPGITAELEREFKLDDRILKYQTVKLSDAVDPQELLLKETREENDQPEEKAQKTEDKTED